MVTNSAKVRLPVPGFTSRGASSAVRYLSRFHSTDQTLDQAFGLSKALVAVSNLASVLQERRKNANIDVVLEFIWRISDDMMPTAISS
jgi:hypothetical protein